jgi:hypothetical protein
MPESGSKKKIVEYIEKTGYPLEIEISSLLENSKWAVTGNYPYVDPEKGGLREIDVYATFPSAFRQGDFLTKPHFLPMMLVECKKSTTDSLILFPRPNRLFSWEDLEGQVFDYPRLLDRKPPASSYGPPDFLALGLSRFLVNSVHQTKMKACNTYTLTSEKKMIFEAVATLLNAQSGLMESERSKKTQFLPGTRFHTILFTYLVIVFDGPMFEATVRGGKTEVEETYHSLIRAAWNPKGLAKLVYYSIDVVHPGFFAKYLELLQQDISGISKSMEDNKQLEEYLSVDQSNPSDSLSLSEKLDPI